MNVALIYHISEEFYGQLKQKLLDFYKEKNILLFSRRSIANNETTDFMQWIIDLCRKNKLLPLKQVVIQPVYNQQQIIQLCLAQLSKKNSNVFEAEASDVLDLWKLLYRVAVEGDCNSDNNWLDTSALKELREAMEAYRVFLSSSGCLDHFSLLKLLKRETKKEDNAIFKALDNTLIIIEELEDFSMLYCEFFKILFANANISRISVSTHHQTSNGSAIDLNISGVGEDPLDESVTPQSERTTSDFSIHVEESNCQPESIFVRDKSYGTENSYSSSSSRGSVLFVEQLFLSHIRLLLNTRDELAIVCLLTMPGRDLDRKEINAIKSVAAKKNLPIYQTIMSTIMKLNLGGKGYQPDDDCPIVKRRKELSQFVESMMKLETIIENKCHNDAFKVLSSIKSNMKKLRGKALPLKSIEEVYNRMRSLLDQSASRFSGEDALESPERRRAFSSQTLSVSKKPNPALQHLLHVCDFYAGRNTSFLISDATGSHSLTPATPPTEGIAFQSPFRVPSILSLFKSPDTPLSLAERGKSTPLRERIDKKGVLSTPGKENKPMRFQSFCSWAREISPLASQSRLNSSSISPIYGPTLRALGQREKSKNWKEIIAELPPTEEVAAGSGVNEEEKPIATTTATKSRKRSLLSDISNIENAPTKTKKKKDNLPSKKSETPKKAPKTSRLKKEIPKWQLSITTFFKK